MRNKVWRTHVKSVLSGEKRSVLSMVLGNLSAGTGTRRRFLAPSPLGYISDTASGILATLHSELTDLVNGTERKGMAMEDFDKAKEVDQIIERLKKVASQYVPYQNILDEKTSEIKTRLRKMERRSQGPIAGRERELLKLGLVLLESAKYGDQNTLREYLDCDFPINFQHPLTNRTALHNAMAGNKSEYAEILMDSGRCDYLLRTNVTGDLACDYSYYNCTDRGLADRLDVETMKQAIKRGVDIETLFDKRPDYARKPTIDDLSR
ncbi:hypothetical protein [Nitrosomonas sp.]|uniref:hypothetical protein n=1 Tax=Nitrosomonas sp. TaxID=42353 RepID=UPI002086BBF4|nr:hypothetical protein [Nitrosomonas sp.]GJL75960.1 MAG: hypothetical protein NMNS02_20660 [Nitrosomonas sp.]